ncbi:mechanosensitive ion channel family protein [Fenollaria sporofastidiosus]|uniref:mechanosensitive ion channel family protein n=1 Tax=Fenollaria sporofastidiosus TaxID=2811778 RepID=UPI001C0087E4|nr:mechanosensitive ion channel family protein [Fenollaria sporofastidiosus]
MFDKLKLHLMNEAGGLNTLGRVALAALYLVIAIVVIKVIGIIIARLARKKYDKLRAIDAKRVKTVLSVMKSFVTIIIIFTWFLSALRIFGVNTSAIITTAGIGGIAISFGAKSLVEDIISGIFLMLEDSFVIGDDITVAGKTGIVERISLRTTTIRDYNGELHVVPNGEIRVVTNRNKNIQRALINVPIAYDADAKKAVDLLTEALKPVNDDHAVIEDVSVWGITDFASSGIVITCAAKTIPGEQWRVERVMRSVALGVLNENNIRVLDKSIVIDK